MSGVVEVPDLIEPAPIQDDFIQGIARIERVGPCVRLTYYAEQTLPELGGATVRVVVRKVVIPLEAVQSANRQVAEFLARDAEGKVIALRRR